AAPKSSPSPAAMQTPKPVSHVLVAPDLRPVATSNEPKNQTGSNQPSATSGVATANQAPGNDQKSAASSNSTSSHPRPPALKPTPKPANQNQDSKFNSFIKKAGRVIKKPFEN